MIFGVLNPEEI